MMGGNPLPPDPNPDYWKAQAERRSELLRSGRSTDGLGGVLELFWSLGRFIFSVLTRPWKKRN